MSDATTHLLLPYILAAQAQKHVRRHEQTDFAVLPNDTAQGCNFFPAARLKIAACKPPAF